MKIITEIFCALIKPASYTSIFSYLKKLMKLLREPQIFEAKWYKI